MKKTSPQQTNAQTKAQTKAHTKTPRNDAIDDLLLQLWQKNLPTIRERLDLMDKLGSAAVSGSLEEHTRLEALSIAHKLAGSLGMYGYQQGTEVAAKMERILKFPTPETLVTLRALAADLRKSLAAGL
jgi:HPt (histidine-containing phosphotransfer) domain-containing protein